jgi:hypothetical protein
MHAHDHILRAEGQLEQAAKQHYRIPETAAGNGVAVRYHLDTAQIHGVLALAAAIAATNGGDR